MEHLTLKTQRVSWKMSSILPLTMIIWMVSAAAYAVPVTVNFPSNSSTFNASATNFFWLTTHMVDETFTGIGFSSVNQLDLALHVNSNVLNRGGNVNFNALVNNTVVGSFGFVRSDGTGIFNYSFNFAPIVGNGTYNLKLAVTNNVPRGRGSVRFGQRNSLATLDGSPIPEPSTMLLFGTGLVGLLGWQLRKRKAD